jgi:hypothetical protein
LAKQRVIGNKVLVRVAIAVSCGGDATPATIAPRLRCGSAAQYEKAPELCPGLFTGVALRLIGSFWVPIN